MVIRENGEIDSKDDVDLDVMLPLEDNPMRDEEFGADYEDMLGLVA